MILLSGSSEREIVDLQQGDYEEMDQMNVARPHCKASFRINSIKDIPIGNRSCSSHRCIRTSRWGVYVDLPAKLFGQTISVEES